MAFEMTAASLKRVVKERGGYTSRLDLNEILHLHCKGILEIKGLEPFTGLKTLYLESNAIAEIENLEPCADLLCLYLARNVIAEVGPGLAPLRHLVTLDLSENALESLAGLGCCRQLRTLNVGKNRLAAVEDVADLLELPALEALDLSANRLADASAVCEGVLWRLPPTLNLLRTLGNPFVKQVPAYRKTILARLPHLNSFDDLRVFPKDVRLAQAFAAGGVAQEREERALIREEEAAAEVRKREYFNQLVEEAKLRPPVPHDPMRFRAVPFGESDDEGSAFPGGGSPEPEPEPERPASTSDEDEAVVEGQAEEEEVAKAEEAGPPPGAGEAEERGAAAEGENEEGPPEAPPVAEPAAVQVFDYRQPRSAAAAARAPADGSGPSPPLPPPPPPPRAPEGVLEEVHANVKEAVLDREAGFQAEVKRRELARAARRTAEQLQSWRGQDSSDGAKRKEGAAGARMSPVIFGTAGYRDLWSAAVQVGARQEEEEAGLRAAKPEAAPEPKPAQVVNYLELVVDATGEEAQTQAPGEAPGGDDGDEASEAGSSGTEEYYDSDDDRVEARFERYSKVTVAPGAVPTTGTLDGMD